MTWPLSSRSHRGSRCCISAGSLPKARFRRSSIIPGFRRSIWGPAMSDETLLEIHGLSGGYGAETVLQGLDMKIAKGEIVAVIGRNGVGKTTLMRTLCGLLRTSGGTITLSGRDVTHDPADLRARAGIGYIPQGRDVFPELTVRENLLVGEVAGRGRAK